MNINNNCRVRDCGEPPLRPGLGCRFHGPWPCASPTCNTIVKQALPSKTIVKCVGQNPDGGACRVLSYCLCPPITEYPRSEIDYTALCTVCVHINKLSRSTLNLVLIGTTFESARGGKDPETQGLVHYIGSVSATAAAADSATATNGTVPGSAAKGDKQKQKQFRADHCKWKRAYNKLKTG